ncbi:glutaredoxin domain-containing protein [uncultured Sphingomonas sp.]|uniref:glutaredoxin domain-containing protein n=1 Tax=uncultured Sphingomonas sp. TaxID=158754 RepID=UPI0025E77CAB|nr:glutaredoxin domain-containing protein [uncultured Sphingomonas sp.]
MADEKQATLYRMELPDHVCPLGLRARDLLLERGYRIDDRVLRTRDAVEAVKDEFGVATIPVIFLGDERVDGADALEHALATR